MILRSPAVETRLHELAYPGAEPPRRPRSAGIRTPDYEMVSPAFGTPFTALSERHPADLTPVGSLLLELLRRTILPRTGNRDGIIALQQEAGADLFMNSVEEWSKLKTTFPDYRPAKIGDKRRGQRALVATQQQFTLEKRAEKAEQDAGLEGVQTIPSSEDESTDEEYVAVPPMPPRAHDAEAGESAGPSDAPAEPAPASAASSELSQLTATVRLLAESLIATNTRAEQREQRAEERFQFLVEQQRRQSEMFQFQLQYLYQATGVQPPQVPLPLVPMAGYPTPPQLLHHHFQLSVCYVLWHSSVLFILRALYGLLQDIYSFPVSDVSFRESVRELTSCFLLRDHWCTYSVRVVLDRAS
nr:unnamed protein product [Digitaria exilis]